MVKLKIVMLILLILMYPQKASAYIDPGTGSYFLQFLIAILVGGAFLFKNQLKRLRVFIGRLARKK